MLSNGFSNEDLGPCTAREVCAVRDHWSYRYEHDSTNKKRNQFHWHVLSIDQPMIFGSPSQCPVQSVRSATFTIVGSYTPMSQKCSGYPMCYESEKKATSKRDLPHASLRDAMVQPAPAEGNADPDSPAQPARLAGLEPPLELVLLVHSCALALVTRHRPCEQPC